MNLNADGTFEYTPSVGFFGTESFSYTVSDGIEVSNIATATITVLAPPQAINDSITIEIGDSPQIFVIGNDIDLDNNLNTSTVSIVGSTNHGILNKDALGLFTYTQTDMAAIQDVFTYQLMDSDGLTSNIATVTININHAPTNISMSGGAVDENSANGTFVADVDASDLNNDIVSFSLVDDDSDPLNNLFEIDSNTGILTVQNSSLLDFESVQTKEVMVLVTDSAGLTTTKQLTMTINPIDEAPEVGAIVRTLAEGETIRGHLADFVSDPEANIDRYHLLKSPSHGTLEFKPDGSWEYTHNDTENFDDHFVFGVRDFGGNQTFSTVDLIITPVDDMPVANLDSFSTDAATSVQFTQAELLGNDINVDESTTIEIVSMPGTGELIQNSDGTFTYIPDLLENGEQFFEYRIHVDDQVSETARVAFNVSPVSQDPAPSTPSSIVPEEVTVEPAIVEPAASETLEEPSLEPDITTPEEVAASFEENVLQGPSHENAGNSVLVETEEQVTNKTFESFSDRNNEIAEEVAKAQKRSLLWQPRYGVYGNQLVVSTSLSGQSAGQLSVAEQIEAFSGVAYGLSAEFLDDLDQQSMGQSMQYSDIPILTFSTSSLLTVGYLVWAIRAGALVSTFISMPAWTQFDPLPVIEKGIPVNFGEDDDSLEKLVDTV